MTSPAKRKAATAATKPVQDGRSTPKVSNKTPYSNGTVDITVFGGGRKIKAVGSGVACYTGLTPPAGLPTNDEVTIDFPQALMNSATRTFSFSGPITLTPAEAQSDRALRTTLTLQGHFVGGKRGTSATEGTDSSPISQSATPKRFSSPYAAGAG